MPNNLLHRIFISLIIFWILTLSLTLTLTFEDVFYRNDDVFADASHRLANKVFHPCQPHTILGLQNLDKQLDVLEGYSWQYCMKGEEEDQEEARIVDPNVSYGCILVIVH